MSPTRSTRSLVLITRGSPVASMPMADEHMPLGAVSFRWAVFRFARYQSVTVWGFRWGLVPRPTLTFLLARFLSREPPRFRDWAGGEREISWRDIAWQLGMFCRDAATAPQMR